MEVGNEEQNNNLEVQILLHDHAQSSEDARYRDTLILHGFYFSLAILAGLIVAAINIFHTYWLCALVSLISAAIFFIFLISLRSISAARNAAWANRKRIEGDARLKGLVNINKWIVERLDEMGKRKSKDFWERRSAANWVWRFQLVVFIGWSLLAIVSILLQIGVI